MSAHAAHMRREMKPRDQTRSATHRRLSGKLDHHASHQTLRATRCASGPAHAKLSGAGPRIIINAKRETQSPRASGARTGVLEGKSCSAAAIAAPRAPTTATLCRIWTGSGCDQRPVCRKMRPATDEPARATAAASEVQSRGITTSRGFGCCSSPSLGRGICAAPTCSVTGFGAGARGGSEVFERESMLEGG